VKKNASPELNARWWTTQQPDGLDGKELARALADYESAQARLTREGPENNLSACLKALGQIDSAARKLEAEALKLARNPPAKSKADADEYTHTAEALKKYPRLTDAARKTVSATPAQAEDDEDEDAEGLLNSPEEYKQYLKAVLRKLTKRSMNFAIGLGKKPGDHRFLFHRTKPARAMGAAIKKETGLPRLAWGVAGAHAERPLTLVLALESPQAPGLKKKAERLLKLNKPLPFNRVMLMVEGEEAEDVFDPEDTEVDELDALDSDESETEETVPAARAQPDTPSPASGEDEDSAFKTRLAALLPRIKEAGSNDARLKASEAGVMARKKDFAGARRLLDEAEALLAQGGAVDAGPAFNARLATLLGSIKDALANGAPGAQDARLKASEAGVLARKKDFAAANALLDDADRRLTARDAASSTAAGNDDLRAQSRDTALAQWQTARGDALTALRQLENAFRNMQHAASDRAIILLRAIQANLTAAPTSLAQIAELENYLNTDRIITEAEMPNGFGFKVQLRAPLLAALTELRHAAGAEARA